jgi:hypothetical protein
MSMKRLQSGIAAELNALLAVATFLPTTLFFHRAPSPAHIPPGAASNPKPSGYVDTFCSEMFC